MDKISFKIDITSKPGKRRNDSSIIYIAILISVNNREFDGVLDVDEFFNSFTNEGVMPLFTCSCGIFGCGGFYVEIVHQNTFIEWNIERSKFIFDKTDIVNIGKRLMDELRSIVLNNNEFDVRVVSIGSIDDKIDYYKDKCVFKYAPKNG